MYSDTGKFNGVDGCWNDMVQGPRSDMQGEQEKEAFDKLNDHDDHHLFIKS